MTVADTSARLIVDVDAVVANYDRLRHELGSVSCAAVVKSNCYGLGLSPIVERLWRAGCRHFFVARVSEGVVLRELVPEATISVLDGVPAGSESDLAQHRLMPVVNSLRQLDRWRDCASRLEQALPAILHADTGMLRLGLTPADVETVVDEPHRLAGIDVKFVMSHLASADEADNPQSERQLDRFVEIRQRLPMGGATLANSAGIFRGPEYHFDLARPGYALYGGNPEPASGANPMLPVVHLEVPILQVRSADKDETVGYGGTYVVRHPLRLATIGIGYADGFLRTGSNRGAVFIEGHEAPIIGRVSMDLTTIDVTDVPHHLAAEGRLVEVVGSHRTVDGLADDAGTIGYEILTRLGSRYRRRYVEDG